MRYFYNKKTGEYLWGTSESVPVPKGCGETSARPDAGRYWNGSAWTEKGKSKPAQRKARAFDVAAYTAKAAAYTDRQLQAGMMRAKGQKLEILQAEKVNRGLS